MNDHDDELDNSTTRAVHRRDLGRIVRLVLAIILVVALVAVALDNTDDVRVGYAVGDANAPVWMVLVIAAVAGILISSLLRFRARRHS
jgi:uncharacterized integral membrane protein